MSNLVDFIWIELASSIRLSFIWMYHEHQHIGLGKWMFSQTGKPSGNNSFFCLKYAALRDNAYSLKWFVRNIRNLSLRLKNKVNGFWKWTYKMAKLIFWSWGKISWNCNTRNVREQSKIVRLFENLFLVQVRFIHLTIYTIYFSTSSYFLRLFYVCSYEVELLLPCWITWRVVIKVWKLVVLIKVHPFTKVISDLKPSTHKDRDSD